MKTLVVYDSVYGNTEKIARAIGAAIAGEVEVLRVGEVNYSEMDDFNLLIVGSPTHGGRPTQATRDFLKKVPESVIAGSNVATFDTRLVAKWIRIFGYAAGRIASSLEEKSGILTVPPEPFFVEGSEGPLRDGEVSRAADWAKEIVRIRISNDASAQ